MMVMPGILLRDRVRDIESIMESLLAVMIFTEASSKALPDHAKYGRREWACGKRRTGTLDGQLEQSMISLH